ncbi:MAG TPA: MBL fold metallo-hydrolase [Candidatus Paceibacterota bacterium]
MEPKTQLVLEEELISWSGHRWFRIGVLLIMILDVVAWAYILSGKKIEHSELYFLNVGQGDSSLALLPGGVKVLIDGGPMNGVLQKNLETILPIQDRYVDVVAMTHPQQDHYGGFLELFRNYKIGIFITSGYDSTNDSWKELQKIIAERKIPTLVLDEMDIISYGDTYFRILSPRPGEKVKDVNDASLVMRFEESGVRALFTGDISAKKEKELTRRFNIDVDILKISHHGSKYSSDPVFLKEASPLVSIVEVGKNSYGHPTQQTLNRLADIGTQIYRTDQDSILKVVLADQQIQIFKTQY